MSSFLKVISRAGAAALILAASACARPVGDFGRAPSDPVHDGTFSPSGARRNLLGPVSSVNLTDQEKEMRNRVWRYLVSPEDYDWLGDSIAELERVGFGSPRFHPLSVERYYLWLHGTDFASSRVRYTRLSADVRADLGTMPGVFRAICAVEGIDRQRGIAIGALSGIGEGLQMGVTSAHAENQAVIAWFTRAVDARFRSYSYALDHLLVETPHEEAVGVNVELSELEIYVDAAGEDQFCAPQSRRPFRPQQSDVDSRYEHNATYTAGS